MLTTGSQGLYDWLASDRQISDLLELCPEVVLGKYVAITSIDSGALLPTSQQSASGWQSREKIAYTPKIQRIEDLPRAGWDEWYVFVNPADLGTSHLSENVFEVPLARGQVNVFVNYCFALHQAEMAHMADLFWQQIEWIRPESYIADNDFLTFVTTNKALYIRVRDALNA